MAERYRPLSSDQVEIVPDPDSTEASAAPAPLAEEPKAEPVAKPDQGKAPEDTSST